MADLITPQELQALVCYCPKSGILTWLPRGLKGWDTRYAGTEALGFIGQGGYKRGIVRNVSMRAHRVAWAVHFGYWPNEIDHINGDKADNRIENLRDVSRRENSRNKPVRSDNRSGVAGVRFVHGKWTARIFDGLKSHFLGSFKTLKEAAAARETAKAALGFHQNHGRPNG